MFINYFNSNVHSKGYACMYGSNFMNGCMHVYMLIWSMYNFLMSIQSTQVHAVYVFDYVSDIFNDWPS